jgi:hypothetical protein
MKPDPLEPIKKYLANLKYNQQMSEEELVKLEAQIKARTNDIFYLEKAIEEAEKLTFGIK